MTPVKQEPSRSANSTRRARSSTAIRLLLAFVVLISVALFASGCGQAQGTTLAGKERVRIATTTSLYDTGLWSYLEPMFEKKYGVELDILYAGTGIALEYGRRGDVDAVAVHAKATEQQFIDQGYGLQRVPFAYNYFVIVGPASDPAGIQGLSPEEGLRKIYQAASTSFISRGDQSGTHVKEQALWKSAGFTYDQVHQSGSWYVDAGRGMGPTLLMASEKQGYTLTDIGTYLAYKGQISLVPLIDKGASMLNVYSIIAVNPAKIPTVKAEMAQNLIDFLTSPEIQKAIGEYGVKQYKTPLFIPCAGNEPQS